MNEFWVVVNNVYYASWPCTNFHDNFTMGIVCPVTYTMTSSINKQATTKKQTAKRLLWVVVVLESSLEQEEKTFFSCLSLLYSFKSFVTIYSLL
jgi:hypothetical protein